MVISIAELFNITSCKISFDYSAALFNVRTLIVQDLIEDKLQDPVFLNFWKVKEKHFRKVLALSCRKI